MKCPSGFTPITDLPFEIGSNRALFSEQGGKLQLFGNTAKKSLWGIVRFHEYFVGPPEHAHGGAQAYALDESMGTVCWNSGIPVVAKSITIEFKKPVPLNTDLIITAQVGRKLGKATQVKSALLHNDQILAIGKGAFHILTHGYIAKMVGGAKPDLSRWFPSENSKR